MIKKLILFGSILLMLVQGGCMKDTYEMKRLSPKVQLSPSMVISAVKGNVTFADMVKANDTVVFNNDKSVKIVFRKESIIDFKLADFYNLTDMITYSKSYAVGEMDIAPFYQTLNFTLASISARFTTTLRNQFISLNYTTSIFPPFPSTNLQDNIFPSIPNLEYATFSSGAIDITVKNNLRVLLNSGASISLFNATGRTPIGTAAIFPAIPAGEVRTVTIDLANKYVTNNVIAAIILPGTPGSSPNPVYIDLNGSGVEIGIRGRDMKVKSGKVKIPLQKVTSITSNEVLDFNPGSGVEIERVKITNGNLSFKIQSAFPNTATLGITLPTALRTNGDTLKATMNLNNGSNISGSISVSNTIFNLSSFTQQPYNRMPVQYNISLTTNNSFVIFSKDDLIKIDLEILNPEFDYVKGYFGKQTESIGPDSLDLDIADILSHVAGSFSVSSPSIKLNYSNSFPIPIEVTLQALGKRENKPDVNLNLTPPVIQIAYPVYPTSRDASSSITIDKTNSKISELISMIPEKIRFSGSAVINPAATPGVRNNYVFGESRFLGTLEVEVPMEFRINNLQFKDTVDNFLKDESSDSDNPIKPENFDSLQINIVAENGFPMGVSVSMGLYNSTTHAIDSVSAASLLLPAQVGTNGKTTPVESTTELKFTKKFFNSIKSADKIIIRFKLNTTDSNTKDVKFYSDYGIKYNVTVVAKPHIIFDLN
jgi:hypothetical protein